MKIIVQNLIVDMDMVLKASKQVWPWEVSVLQAKHGEGKVRLMDTTEEERPELPNAGEEFSRLTRAYGIDGGQRGTNMSYTELAYGRGRAGIAELAKEIKRAGKPKRASKKKTAKKAKAAVEPAAQSDDAVAGDPLEF